MIKVEMGNFTEGLGWSYRFPPELGDHIELSKGSNRLLDLTSKNVALLNNTELNRLVVAVVAAREVVAEQAFTAPKLSFRTPFKGGLS